MYRCEAESVTGFVQQLACAYVRNGYHHYVVGEIPERKVGADTDARIIERYGLDITRSARARRKLAQLSNVHYIRYRRFFVLCATNPTCGHEFFTWNAGQIRNIKDTPLSFGGYSIGYHRGVDGGWHVSVRIHPERYRDLKAKLLEAASKRSGASIAEEFSRLPFEPYAPVRRQLLNILRAVNRVRSVAGLEKVPFSALRLRRRIVRPFGDERRLEEAA